jgi:26S proteasome regulatory subunit T2
VVKTARTARSVPAGGPLLTAQPAAKKWEPPLPTRVGKKKKRGPDASTKLPPVFPTTRCKLKMLKMERIKDYLLMEEGE